MTTSMRERSERREQERRRRKDGIQAEGRLGLNPDLLDLDRFAYRWINDQPGRLISKTKHDDWDMVPDTGEKEDNTDLGSKVSIVVGTMPDGSPKRAYLCRKPKTFYHEDKAEEQAALDRQLAEMRRGNDRFGNSQSDYVPSSGINIR